MFLVFLLFLVLIFYPYNEGFVDLKSIETLHKKFNDTFKSSHNSIMVERGNYMTLYTNLR